MGYLERLQPLLIALLGCSALAPEKGGIILNELKDRLHFVEMFAGEQNLSSGIRQLGYIGLSIDKRYSSDHDFMSKEGFLLSLTALMRIWVRWGRLFEFKLQGNNVLHG